MINLVVWIWQYQESETNKYRESRRQKYKKHNIFGFLALPKTKALLPSANAIFFSSRLNIFFRKKASAKVIFYVASPRHDDITSYSSSIAGNIQENNIFTFS